MNIELLIQTAKDHFQEGITTKNKEHFEIATYIADKLIQTHPAYMEQYQQIGVMPNKLEKPYEALQMINQAIELEPEKTILYIFRAETYRQIGKSEAAKKSFIQAKNTLTNKTAF